MKKIIIRMAVLAALVAFCAPGYAVYMLDVYPGEMTNRAAQKAPVAVTDAPEQDDAEWHYEDPTDAEIIACVVYNEAAYGCTDRHQELVAAVIVNRVHDDRFPATVYGVVTQPGQYLPDYAIPGSYYWSRAVNSDVWTHCLEIAERALAGEIDCPADVVYQANFEQGYGVYEIWDTSYSRTWFCYG